MGFSRALSQCLTQQKYKTSWSVSSYSYKNTEVSVKYWKICSWVVKMQKRQLKRSTKFPGFSLSAVSLWLLASHFSFNWLWRVNSVVCDREDFCTGLTCFTEQTLSGGLWRLQELFVCNLGRKLCPLCTVLGINYENKWCCFFRPGNEKEAKRTVAGGRS